MALFVYDYYLKLTRSINNALKHKKIKSQLKPAKNKTKIPEIVTSNAVPRSGWRATIRKQAKMKRIAINVSLKLIGSFLWKR